MNLGTEGHLAMSEHLDSFVKKLKAFQDISTWLGKKIAVIRVVAWYWFSV